MSSPCLVHCTPTASVTITTQFLSDVLHHEAHAPLIMKFMPHKVNAVCLSHLFLQNASGVLQVLVCFVPNALHAFLFHAFGELLSGHAVTCSALAPCY
jgi:hypothetical protein